MGLTDEQYRKVMRKGWNLTVDEYARSWVDVLRRYSEVCLDFAAPQAGERVIDIATGPGTAALLAAQRVGPSGSVLGTDISDAYIETATRAAAAADARNVRFERHAMEDLSGVADGSFDVALCILGLMYAAPAEAALGEAKRVLAPGGRFAGCVWGRREKNGFRDVFSILSGPLQMDICPNFFALGTPGAFAADLEHAGLHEAREERIELVLRWKTDEEACAAMFDGGPAAYPYSMFPPELRSKVASEYVESLAAYRTTAGFEVPAEFVCASAKHAA